MSSTPIPRDAIQAISGYHSPQVDVPVRLNTNESPFSPPQGFVSDWADAIRAGDWNRYPDREVRVLRAALAEQFNVGTECIWAANGSNEVLQLINLVYGGSGRTVMVFEPTYALHQHIAAVTGATIISLPRTSEYRIDPTAASAAILEHRPAIVMLCTPNNPTGTVEDPKTVDAVLTVAKQVGALVVADEAYAEFSGQSVIDIENPNLIVVRTFSKVWSLAGVRLGYAIAAPQIINLLIAATLPYHLSTVVQQGGELALRYSEEMSSRVSALQKGRSVIEEGLAELGVRFWPSGANFVLFQVGDQADDIWNRLLELGVLVRNCASWNGLAGCLRVTVGTPSENDAFLTALRTALEGLK